MDPIPYSRQSITEADIAAVTDVLRAPFLTQGPAIERFEIAFANRHGGGHAVAVANATGALHIACMALGVGAGDVVWTSPISFVASANCARYCNADVDFVDIDPVTRNMSVDQLSAKLEQAAHDGRLPKVVIPIAFSGLPADMRAIRALADRYGFAIVEDASHAVGATIDDEPVGARFADISVFSFHPVKIVTTGEGGLCLTRDTEIADRLRLLRSHGVTRNPAEMRNPSEGPWYYEQVTLGYNYRLTDLQAALGSSQLERLNELHTKRAELAAHYDAALADLPLKLPARPQGFGSAHHLYVVEVEPDRSSIDRRALFDALLAQSIRANVHYIPIHLQPDYEGLGFARGMFPAAERYYDNAITIPLYPDLSFEEQDRVIATLRSALSA